MLEFKMLNISIHAMEIKTMHEMISHAIKTNTRLIIASQNLHSVYLAQINVALQQLHSRAYKHIDGMPLIWFGKLLGYPLKREHRVTWVDWMHPFMDESQKNNWSVYYLGSKQEVVEKAVNKLREKYPRLTIEYSNGYFDKNPASDENKQRVTTINETSPDILLVGMGMPLQEEWINNNLESLNVPVILTCGAAMEYVAGAAKTPPRWMGKCGLEWLYRLAENPRRFAHRYVVEPWLLAPLAFRDIFRRIKNPR